jgi:hypothetical protein
MAKRKKKPERNGRLDKSKIEKTGKRKQKNVGKLNWQKCIETNAKKTSRELEDEKESRLEN